MSARDLRVAHSRARSGGIADASPPRRTSPGAINPNMGWLHIGGHRHTLTCAMRWMGPEACQAVPPASVHDIGVVQEPGVLAPPGVGFAVAHHPLPGRRIAGLTVRRPPSTEPVAAIASRLDGVPCLRVVRRFAVAGGPGPPAQRRGRSGARVSDQDSRVPGGPDDFRDHARIVD